MVTGGIKSLNIVRVSIVLYSLRVFIKTIDTVIVLSIYIFLNAA